MKRLGGERSQACVQPDQSESNQRVAGQERILPPGPDLLPPPPTVAGTFLSQFPPAARVTYHRKHRSATSADAILAPLTPSS